MEETAGYYNKLDQQHNQAYPSKFYTHFLYKALLVAIFLIILPLFPSQAPEFIKQTLNTRGWEFLHLLFVGIAVSYGLFSRRQDATEKETNNNNNNHSIFDNAQSYMSRFLQVSSFFDDDIDSPPSADGEKVQTWSNRYYRNEPIVVVAEQEPRHSVIDKEQRINSSRIAEKPLLLPVRSLKSRVVDADVNETSKESNGVSGSTSRSSSNSASKRFSSNYHELEENLKDNVVLPSPIPWRSRSLRMEMKEGADSPPLYTLPPSMVEPEYNRSFRPQVSRSSRPNSATSSPILSPLPSMSSPKKLSPSPSFASETQGKSAEDFVRKKRLYRSSPPPPPPPPPPPRVIQKAPSMKPIVSSIDDVDDFVSKDFKRSYTSEPRDFNRGSSYFILPKLVRKTRSNNSLAGINKDAEKGSKEVEATAMERTGRKPTGFDQRLNRESVTSTWQPTYVKFPEDEKEEFVQGFEVDSEEDLETEEDDDDVDMAASSNVSGAAATRASNNGEATSSSASDGGPDVDKKADEFIAKFREQIRLQRIDSIKRSSAQMSRKGTR